MLGEINSMNRGIISGKKKVHKIIIHFAVAAHEYSMSWGSAFWQMTKKKRFPLYSVYIRVAKV